MYITTTDLLRLTAILAKMTVSFSAEFVHYLCEGERSEPKDGAPPVYSVHINEHTPVYDIEVVLNCMKEGNTITFEYDNDEINVVITSPESEPVKPIRIAYDSDYFTDIDMPGDKLPNIGSYAVFELPSRFSTDPSALIEFMLDLGPSTYDKVENVITLES